MKLTLKLHTAVTLFMLCLVLLGMGTANASEYAFAPKSVAGTGQYGALIDLDTHEVIQISAPVALPNMYGVQSFVYPSPTQPNKMYAAGYASGYGNYICVINADSGTIENQMSTTNLSRSFAVSEDGTKLYAIPYSETDGLLPFYVYWTVNNTLKQTVTSYYGYTRGVEFSPNGTYLYTARAQYGTYRVFNSLTDTFVTPVNVGGVRTYDLVHSPVTDRMYLTSAINDTFAVVNTTNHALLAQVPLPARGYGITISENGSYVYIATAAGIKVVDTATNSIVDTIRSDRNFRALEFNHDYSKLCAFDTSPSFIILNATTFDEELNVTDTGNLSNMYYPFGHDFIFTGGVTAAFSANTTSGVEPLAVSFTDSSIGNITDWYWIFGDGYTSTAENPVHVYNDSGLYTVRLQVSDGIATDWENKSNYINVSAIPGTVTADFHANVTSTGVGNQIQFLDDSVGATSLEWDFTNDGIIDSTAANPIVTYGTTGVFSVALTAHNASSENTKTRYNYITITSDGPGCLGCDFSANVTSGQYPLTVQFADLSTGSPDEWSWNFGDGGSSTLQNPVHTYTSLGSYTVTFTASADNGTYSKTKVKTNYITATEPTTTGTNFTANVTYGGAPLVVNFTDTSTNSPTAWNWTFGDGNTSTAQNPTNAYNATGIYTVSLTTTNSVGTGTLTKVNYIQVYQPNYGGLYGYVYDSQTLEPVASASLVIYNNSSTSATYITPSTGVYYFWPVYNGVYTLSASKTGYADVAFPNTVINSTSSLFNIYMVPNTDVAEGINITNYTTDWLNLSFTTNPDTYSASLYYNVTSGYTSYANFTVLYSNGTVASTSNISSQFYTFNFNGTSGNNYIALVSIRNSEGRTYTGAFPMTFFRGLDTGWKLLPDDFPVSLSSLLIFAFSMLCLYLVGQANVFIGMVMSGLVLLGGYTFGLVTFGSIPATSVFGIIAIVCACEYIREKRLYG